MIGCVTVSFSPRITVLCFEDIVVRGSFPIWVMILRCSFDEAKHHGVMLSVVFRGKNRPLVDGIAIGGGS